MTIRDIDYDTNQDSEKVYSRLTWAVEKVDGLFSQLVNGGTVDTNKRWVGTLNKEKMKFRLIEPGGFFNTNFMQVIVRGQIISSDNKTTVNIRLELGWYPLFVSAVVYLGTFGMVIMTALFGQRNDIANLILWIAVFPVLWTIILKRKMDKVEKKVENLLGIG